MNCIYCCVFAQEKYVEMFLLLLKSICIYGNLDKDTHILVYTSTHFMNIIQKSPIFNSDKIHFEINDTYNDINKACKARLDLFNFKSILNYDKILYLDTDIIVKGDISKIFNLCNEDILYVLEEGSIDCPSTCWGNILFGDEVNNYEDKTGFTSGVMLFNNCPKIKDLFNNINKSIVDRPYNFSCYDQPYIVYNALKYNLYNNKVMKDYVLNTFFIEDMDFNSNKPIQHFPAGAGNYTDKLILMNLYFNNLK